MTAIDIRLLTADHLPAVKALIDGVGLFPSGLLDDLTAPFLAGAAPEAPWLVALRDGAPCAVVHYAPERFTEGTWNLLLVAVRRDCQGQGLASLVTRHVERQLADRGARMLLIETSGLPAFEHPRAVYRHLGYVEEARIREFYARSEDKVIFRKILSD